MKHSFTYTVEQEDTAARMGSGLLPVYATPAVVALMENTACRLIAALPEGAEGALREGETTVGTRIAVDHVRACKPGTVVTAEAELLGVEGRKYEFAVTVTDADGNLLAKAEHTRFLVAAERFMAKLD